MLPRLLGGVCVIAVLVGTLGSPTMTPIVGAQGPTCDDFLFQEDAQAALDDVRTVAPLLDEDRDRIACNDLPSLAKTGFVRPAPPPGAKRGRVREVIDGDTIRVSFGRTLESVRVIGVDTPEISDSSVGIECFGSEATAYTESLLPPGTIVWLDRDVTDRDQYDRLLRYVWFEQGEGRYRLLNDALVRDGYAVVSTYPPDVAYVDWLQLAQEAAVARGLGLWSACGGGDAPVIQSQGGASPNDAPSTVPVPPVSGQCAGYEPWNGETRARLVRVNELAIELNESGAIPAMFFLAYTQEMSDMADAQFASTPPPIGVDANGWMFLGLSAYADAFSILGQELMNDFLNSPSYDPYEVARGEQRLAEGDYYMALAAPELDRITAICG